MKKIILILVGFTLLLSSCNNAKGINDDEIKQGCKANAISNEQLADLLYSKDIKGVQFIDIRTPHKYAMGHLPNAINVPMKNFFDDAYFSKINKDDYLILYGDDASTPKLMALLGGHYNKGKFYVALGGYDYIKTKILDGFGIYSGLYNDEEPLVDFEKAVNEIRSRAGGSAKKAVKAKASSKPIVKRKKKEVSGGCG
jgi:predicted small secreted protein